MPAQKRAAPASSETNGKRSKTDKPQKYYGVHKGHQRGVYRTWAECQKQTSGFPGATYKSFTTYKDAEIFAAGGNPSGGGKSSKPKATRYYAVASAKRTGIFTNWDDISDAIIGTKGPKYKKFETLHEAFAYMKQWGEPNVVAKARAQWGKYLGGETSSSDADPPVDFLEIYTDGSSLGNGKANSRAGVGVWFGPGDERNVSERLEGEVQTNQRAELTAILRALEKTPETRSVRIYTDSTYSRDCVTTWYKTWESKNWKTSIGGEVKNKDLVQAIRKKIVSRAEAGSEVEFVWVKGHSNNAGNAAADRLAVAGAHMSLPAPKHSAESLAAVGARKGWPPVKETRETGRVNQSLFPTHNEPYLDIKSESEPEFKVESESEDESGDEIPWGHNE
ncbi:Ribonuclease H1 [Colletotrichum sidae]|nr:Ribonuclease H1 [Colletotrichum sidae]